MTMNEMDGETRHAYDRYMLETLQLEWEHDQALRDASQAQHVGDEHTHGMAVTADESMTGDVGDVKPLGRPFTYPSGVVADGWAEYLITCLCWSCDREAEYAGYCEPHYEQWLQEVAGDEQPDLVWEEEWDDLMSAEELERAEREAEEGRDDH